MNLIGMALVVALTGALSPTPADWSVSPAFGPAVAAPGTPANPELMPGQSSTSGWLVDHTDAIDGPLDVTASSTDAPSGYEDDILVTVAINGVPGQTRTLGDLLRRSGIARATNALPNGPDMLTVTTKLDANAPASDRVRSVTFTLSVTVSDEVVTLPAQPSDPGRRPVPPLATTGQTISAAAILAGVSALGIGLFLLLRRRSRGRLSDIGTGTD